MCTNWPSWAKSWHTSVKWCRSSSCRIVRIRSIPSWLPSWQPSAKQESVGYAISPSSRTRSTTCPIARRCGFSGCTSKYLAMTAEPTAPGRSAVRSPPGSPRSRHCDASYAPVQVISTSRWSVGLVERAALRSPARPSAPTPPSRPGTTRYGRRRAVRRPHRALTVESRTKKPIPSSWPSRRDPRSPPSRTDHPPRRHRPTSQPAGHAPAPTSCPPTVVAGTTVRLGATGHARPRSARTGFADSAPAYRLVRAARTDDGSGCTTAGVPPPPAPGLGTALVHLRRAPLQGHAGQQQSEQDPPQRRTTFRTGRPSTPARR